MIELSVVLISKNQEWNIARLVESVVGETAFISAKEIMLVDSASTDRTTEIAAGYDITVLKLCPDQRLTAAAGRYVGTNHTTGDFVLFLDGDMELCQGWLEVAIQTMHSHPNIAVITGKVIDRPKHAKALSESLVESKPTDAAGMIIDVPHGGGAALYRRSVLMQVGTFNPYLFSDEEPTLCLRIRHAGYRVIRLSYPIVFHYSAPAEEYSTFLDKRDRKFFLGYGQNIRYFIGSPLLWPYLKERGWALLPALMVCIGIAAGAASLLTSQWGWLALWCIAVTLLTVGIAIRKHSLKRAFLTILLRLFILTGSIKGLLLKPYDPSDYPGRYEVIRPI